MKDVGLDLEGFGVEDGSGTSQGVEDVVPQQLQPSLQSTPIQLPTQPTALPISLGASDPVQPPSLASNSGSQLLAQIQQPLPLTATPAAAPAPQQQQQLQLVQGPDGQFVLQSSVPQPQPFVAQQQTAVLEGGQVLSVSQGAVIASPSVAAMASGPAAAVSSPATVAAVASPSSSTGASRSSPTKNPTSSRSESNRVPLYEDDRLPAGWHRKVSQRKSGASAGRYAIQQTFSARCAALLYLLRFSTGTKSLSLAPPGSASDHGMNSRSFSKRLAKRVLTQKTLTSPRLELEEGKG